MRHFAVTETCGNGRTATPPPAAGEVADALIGGWGGKLNTQVAFGGTLVAKVTFAYTKKPGAYAGLPAKPTPYFAFL